MKILLLDVETAPNTVHTWGLWNQNVSINQIMASGYVMCWAAKWLGEKDVLYDSIYHSSPKAMLKRIHALLNEADTVIHYNGTKFDIPTLNKEFLLHELPPPAPYQQIDLLKTARSRFRFPSNKLDYIAKTLGVGGKLEHKGHQLWIDCMAKDDEAWRTMIDYNVNDVVILEQVYLKLLPWIKGHANYSLHTGEFCCPHCGSKHYIKRGSAFTKAGLYQRYVCRDCKSWFRSTKPETKRPQAGAVNVG